ncbi:serine/threonine-protein kinase Nek5 [Rhinichthys klamathensis goyatoka]|uniref:serine/threonine-protein kinase Nek5 n=1 Tax=Rhinichthys klamathensis goyatoka TaxID=3034132 RepID=UPI0024B4B7D8|nr:serine/threonine-protein kinase Nek5 [Rhinichthys klamathensis goyatoka]
MDHYEVIRQVGQGAFGSALLVKHRHGGDELLYVIKEIHLRQLSARDKDASRKEVTLLSKMRHPNIVAFYKSFYDRDNLYILMEYCDAGDLMNRIKMQRGKPFTEQQIVDWFVQICLGLKHVHDRKVLHRDIKAQNIFLTQGGQKVKLGDFGIAKSLNNTMDLARTCVGTPYYLSPEICENRPYNNKTDIWSLGCVLYELCTLKHPFEGSNLKQLVLRICRGRYSPVSQRYSDELRLLLNQLFKISPRDRPSANTLLRRPLLQAQISKHLDTQLLEDEFSHTVLHGHTPAAPKATNNTDPVGYKPVLKAPVIKAPQRPEQRRNRAKAQQIKPRFPAVFENPIAFKACVDHERRWNGPVERQEPVEDHDTHTLEPYKLVARARDEYLQRRREAQQYKLRAQKQLGLRPSTADAEGCRPPNAQEPHGRKPSQSGKLQGQEEYLKQLQRIREQYHHDVREMRMRAEVEDRGTDLLRKNRDTHTRGKEQQRGIMFEIKLSDEEHTEMKTDEEDEESEDKPLNNTLTLERGENIHNGPHSSEEEEQKKRAGWCRDATDTLLNALERMDVTTESISDTQTASEEQEEGHRKHWTKRLPETLLNALAQAQLTETLTSSDEKRLTEEECDECDDEERLEPRSDDEDTNFEESEDELREEVSDSMRNLFIITQEEDEHTHTDDPTRETREEDEHTHTDDPTQETQEDEHTHTDDPIQETQEEDEHTHTDDPTRETQEEDEHTHTDDPTRETQERVNSSAEEDSQKTTVE